MGLKEGLVECATVCVKSEVILKVLYCLLDEMLLNTDYGHMKAKSLML